jgi:hypothetical protein
MLSSSINSDETDIRSGDLPCSSRPPSLSSLTCSTCRCRSCCSDRPITAELRSELLMSDTRIASSISLACFVVLLDHPIHVSLQPTQPAFSTNEYDGGLSNATALRKYGVWVHPTGAMFHSTHVVCIGKCSPSVYVRLFLIPAVHCSREARLITAQNHAHAARVCRAVPEGCKLTGTVDKCKGDVLLHRRPAERVRQVSAQRLETGPDARPVQQRRGEFLTRFVQTI